MNLIVIQYYQILLFDFITFNFSNITDLLVLRLFIVFIFLINVLILLLNTIIFYYIYFN